MRQEGECERLDKPGNEIVGTIDITIYSIVLEFKAHCFINIHSIVLGFQGVHCPERVKNNVVFTSCPESGR